MIIFIGDSDNELAEKACAFDPQAMLFENNTKINLHATYYTSIGDCEIGNLLQLLDLSDEIYYCPPKKWTKDNNFSDKFSTKNLTERCLALFLTRKNIHGFAQNTDPKTKIDDDYLDLADSRKSEQPQLWVVGDSISHGVGLQKTQRYGELLAKRLGIAVSWLTRPNSSTQWARDQILRSDIRKDDIIAWGLAPYMRFPYYKSKYELLDVHREFYQQHPEFDKTVPETKIDDEDQIYQCITAINQVNNFTEKIGAKLYMLGLDTLDTVSNFYKYCLHFPNYRNALEKEQTWFDLAEGMHARGTAPGPIQHQMFAYSFLSMILQK